MGVSGCWLAFCLILHMLDISSDIFSSIIYFSQGLFPPGYATLGAVSMPGLVAFFLELRSFCKGNGNIFRSILYLIICPLFTWITVLYSLYNKEWRERANFLLVLHGLITAGPQLLIQLFFWIQGYLTIAATCLLDKVDNNITFNTFNTLNAINITDKQLNLLGREYDCDQGVWLELVRVIGVSLSFLVVTVTAVGMSENGKSQCRNCCRVLVGIFFFGLTILFRATSIVIGVAVLGWWGAILLFLVYFLSVMVYVWGTERFARCCLFGLAAMLVPVGHAKDPLMSLGYKVYHQYTIASSDDTDESLRQKEVTKRARLYIFSHFVISLVVVLPGLVVATVVFNMKDLGDMINPSAKLILTKDLLHMILLPGLAMSLAFSFLLGSVYTRLVAA